MFEIEEKPMNYLKDSLVSNTYKLSEALETALFSWNVNGGDVLDERILRLAEVTTKSYQLLFELSDVDTFIEQLMSERKYHKTSQ
jgi:hypothetical protein